MATRQNNPLMVPVGSLNKRIVLLSSPGTYDEAGGPGADVASPPIWAAIDSTYGQNVYQGQFISESTHTVTIRYREGVAPAMRVGFGDRVFNILFIGNPREANVWLVLYCSEVL